MVQLGFSDEGYVDVGRDADSHIDLAVVGLGYVGLPTALAFAKAGFVVAGYDRDSSRVEALNGGSAGRTLLQDLHRGLQDRTFRPSVELASADAYLICVPTPCDQSGRAADLSAVFEAVDAIADRLQAGGCVWLESTSPPGTTVEVARRIMRRRPDLRLPLPGTTNAHDICVAYCPERLTVGSDLDDLTAVPRTVGGLTTECSERARDMYAKVHKGQLRLTSCQVAEVAKLAENASRDVQIAFVNDLAALCAELDVPVLEVVASANDHPRINLLRPGIGVGGHCLPVDPWFLADAVPSATGLIRAARAVNDAMPAFVADRIGAVAGDAEAIGIYGLTYRENTADTRGSPAIAIVEHLAEQRPDLTIAVTDPYLDRLPDRLTSMPNVKLWPMDELTASGIRALVLVAHREFRTLLTPARTLLTIPGVVW